MEQRESTNTLSEAHSKILKGHRFLNKFPEWFDFPEQPTGMLMFIK